jgi:hypothetical protein
MSGHAARRRQARRLTLPAGESEATIFDDKLPRFGLPKGNSPSGATRVLLPLITIKTAPSMERAFIASSMISE